MGSCQAREPHISEVFAAQRRLRAHLSPVMPRLSDSLSVSTAREVWLIPEALQWTGSFKFRGALNRLLLHAENNGGPVITASSGNHAIGMTVAAKIAGVSAKVVVPFGASEAKLAKLRSLGADVVVMGDGFDDAENLMYAYAEKHGLEIVNSFDRDVVAGHATAMLDALSFVPQLDTVIAPVASGGLLAGCAVVTSSLTPCVQMFGVQTESWPAMHASLQSGRIIDVDGAETIADGLAGNASRSRMPFEVIRRTVSEIYLVDETRLYQAVRHGLVHEQLVLEGAGAAAIAALLAGVDLPGNGPIGLILSGGNATEAVLKAALGK
jgi:threonine dehydratase